MVVAVVSSGIGTRYEEVGGCDDHVNEESTALGMSMEVGELRQHSSDGGVQHGVIDLVEAKITRFRQYREVAFQRRHNAIMRGILLTQTSSLFCMAGFYAVSAAEIHHRLPEGCHVQAQPLEQPLVGSISSLAPVNATHGCGKPVELEDTSSGRQDYYLTVTAVYVLGIMTSNLIAVVPVDLNVWFEDHRCIFWLRFGADFLMAVSFAAVHGERIIHVAGLVVLWVLFLRGKHKVARTDLLCACLLLWFVCYPIANTTRIVKELPTIVANNPQLDHFLSDAVTAVGVLPSIIAGCALAWFQRPQVLAGKSRSQSYLLRGKVTVPKVPSSVHFE